MTSPTPPVPWVGTDLNAKHWPGGGIQCRETSRPWCREHNRPWSDCMETEGLRTGCAIVMQ